ncbi:hypothetical protein D3C81_1634740 [compost metagenome]
MDILNVFAVCHIQLLRRNPGSMRIGHNDVVIIHLLQYFPVLDQRLVAIAEIIEHSIMLVGQKQQIVPFSGILNLKPVGVRCFAQRKCPDGFRFPLRRSP